MHRAHHLLLLPTSRMSESPFEAFEKLAISAIYRHLCMSTVVYAQYAAFYLLDDTHVALFCVWWLNRQSSKNGEQRSNMLEA